MIGSKMECGKVFISLLVDPFGKLLLRKEWSIFLHVVLLSVVQDVLEALLGILKG